MSEMDRTRDEVAWAKEDLGGDEVVFVVDDHSLDDDLGLA